MSKYVGTALTVAYNSGAWSANMIRSAEVSETADLAESSGAGDASKTYLHVIKDGTATINFIDDSTNSTITDKFEPGTSSTLTITKTGTATHTGTAIVTNRTVTVPYDGLAVGTATLQFTAGVTQG